MADLSVQKKGQTEQPAPIARREWDPLRMMRDMLRWDPFREMAPAIGSELASYAPAFEVKETKDSFVFKADVPGIKEQDIEVSVTGNRLTINGRRDAEKEEKSDTFYTYERSYGTFTRSFTLPEQADVEHVQAELKSGELTVAIPKKAASVPKKIPVAAGDKPKT
ncbi:MAG TPA: Hsp20/alpha crystallin family protein [Polyangia bacterium]|nr:Hsp20/alpha crystallin family protein [Polyangia bacterium]